MRQGSCVFILSVAVFLFIANQTHAYGVQSKGGELNWCNVS